MTRCARVADKLTGLLLAFFLVSADAQTKYACVTSSGFGSSGEYDTSSSEEFFDSGPIGNSLAEILAGHLTCIDRPNTLILVTKFIYGYGGFSKCAAPTGACDVEEFSDPMITPLCDGQPHCVIKVPARNLPKCGTLSNFVHVEYECVYTWSLYNICQDISSTVKGTSIFIASPNFFNNNVPSSRTCECIVKSRYDDQIMLQYAHTDILDDGNGQCKGNFFLVESKLMSNQSNVDRKTRICGKKTTNNQLYRGTIRITYTISSAPKTDGFLSKLLVQPIGPGGINEIAVECGPVRSDNLPPPNNVSPTKQGPQNAPPNNQGPLNNMGGQHGPGKNHYQGYPNARGPFGPNQPSPRIPPSPVFNGQGNQNGGNPNQWNGNNPGPGSTDKQTGNATSGGPQSGNNGPGNWNPNNGQNRNNNNQGGFDPRMNRPDPRNWQWGPPPGPYGPQGTLQNTNNGPIRNLDLFSRAPQPPMHGQFNPRMNMNAPPPGFGGWNQPPPGPGGWNQPSQGPGGWNQNQPGGNNWQNQGPNAWEKGNNPNQGPRQGQNPNGPPNNGPPNNSPSQNSPPQNGSPQNGNNGQNQNKGKQASPRGLEFIGKMARKKPAGNKQNNNGNKPPDILPAPPPPRIDPQGVAPVISLKENPSTNDNSQSHTTTGNTVAYVIGGIGATLTAVCALFISLYCTRRRKLIRRERSQRAESSSSESSGTMNDVPIYTLPSAFDYEHPSKRPGSARINSAYVESDEGSMGKETNPSDSFDNIYDCGDDDYQTVGDVEVVLGRNLACDRNDQSNDGKNEIHSEKIQKRCQEESIYDNNI